MNAANEVAVAAFLRDEIGFLQIAEVIEETMGAIPYKIECSLDDYRGYDAQARMMTTENISRIKAKI